MTDVLHFITETALLSEINQTGKLLVFQPGCVVVAPEKFIKVIPIVSRGTLKVSRVDEDGNELLLYYLTAGQSCAASLTACLADKTSNIKAVAEEETELIAIPALQALQWFDKYSDWRTFVLNTLNYRFEELLKAVDTLAFSNMDERVLHFLHTKAQVLNSHTLYITHQEIATGLSTSREVISRLLKKLENEGKLSLYRNKIELHSAL